MVDESRSLEKHDTELIKSSGSIGVSGKLSLLQRKTWNVMVANAYPELQKTDVHEIKIKDLCDLSGYNSHDMLFLYQELMKIGSIKVQWDVLDKSGERERVGFVYLLSGAEVIRREGVCRYSFGGLLAEKLYNPRFYGRISLNVQKELSSKHSLVLYELAKDFYISKNESGFTDYISIEKLKELFGVGEDEYKKFEDFNKAVLKKAIKEVNEKSDIYIDALYQKRGRNVVAVKFLIKKNPKQLNLHLETPSGPEMSTVVQALKERGVTLPVAIELVRLFNEEACLLQVEHFDFLQEEARAGRIPHDKAPQGAAWIVRAIEEGWTPPKSFKTKAQKAFEEKLSLLLTTATAAFKQGDFETASIALGEYREAGGQAEQNLEAKIEKALKEQQEKRAVDAYLDSLGQDEKDQLYRLVSEELKAMGSMWRENANKPDSILFKVQVSNHIKKNVLKV